MIGLKAELEKRVPVETAKTSANPDLIAAMTLQ